MKEYRLERASVSDADEVFALYHDLLAAPYSTWSEDYPSKENVISDVSGRKTLVMRDGTDRIVAAIALLSSEDEPELDGIAMWYRDVSRWAVLSRLGVALDMQGKGIAGRMLTAAMEAAREDGCEAVRFLVAKSNPIAQKAYSKIGFDICGEHEMWGHRWLCYQKRL